MDLPLLNLTGRTITTRDAHRRAIYTIPALCPSLQVHKCKNDSVGSLEGIPVVRYNEAYTFTISPSLRTAGECILIMTEECAIAAMTKCLIREFNHFVILSPWWPFKDTIDEEDGTLNALEFRVHTKHEFVPEKATRCGPCE